MLRICLQCHKVAPGGTENWRAPVGADLAHPARSHGYCSDECVKEAYPELKGEKDV